MVEAQERVDGREANERTAYTLSAVPITKLDAEKEYIRCSCEFVLISLDCLSL